ncbi:MAG: ribosome biogenesis GTPase Der [Firmicutes bacterium]|nr:ribosome biogenesis GTPase Der [Bacillota bacterium]MDD4693103.1 ribosome biogenesis GTPase Der [Bacillota bacterium]
MQKGIVAIVGRPNVGKSTLFNRLCGQRKAIVEDYPGVTRDRLYGHTDWNGKEFTVIDTGGIVLGENQPFIKEIRMQAELAVEEADVIIFVVDGRDGITSTDREIADILRSKGKKIVIAANKLESATGTEIWDFYSLGLGEVIRISSEHGIGTGDLLDSVVELLPEVKENEYPNAIKVAIVGKPNVGKSSLVNNLLGEERVIVSEIAGTTRDAIDVPFFFDGQDYVLVDTAGLRKKGRIWESVERYSVIRSLRAIDEADVVLHIIDLVEGVTEQDTKIVGYAHDQGKALIFAGNKWDLIEKETGTFEKTVKDIRNKLAYATYAPITLISAITKQRILDVLELIKEVDLEAKKKVPTSRVNEIIRDAIRMQEPPTDKGIRLRIYYGLQTGSQPPKFTLFVNDPKLMHFSYERYLENRLREAFGFLGSKIMLSYKARSDTDAYEKR